MDCGNTKETVKLDTLKSLNDSENDIYILCFQHIIESARRLRLWANEQKFAKILRHSLEIVRKQSFFGIISFHKNVMIHFVLD